MNIIHAVPGVGNEASGPSYSVPRLAAALVDGGHRVQLLTLTGKVGFSLKGVEHLQYPKRSYPKRLGRSPELCRALYRHAAGADILHNHSLWMMPNVYPGWAARKCHKPLVVSPRGTFSEWARARSKWLKRVVWPLLQRPAITDAACFHATAYSEYEDIRRAGFRQPVCIVPNGVDILDIPSLSLQETTRRQLLFIGRIHPTKGLDDLLRAWHAVASKFPDWDLRVVGPDSGGYLAKMQALAAVLRVQRVTFSGPLYGKEKLRAYQDAELYVLPTKSENFGMTVAEALAAGTPAIVSKGAPWSELAIRNAGWWIDVGADPLVACLEKALATSPSRLASMGQSGRSWMQEEYSWSRVAEMMIASYEWIINGGSPPVWIKY